jgi:hypothetical protein
MIIGCTKKETIMWKQLRRLFVSMLATEEIKVPYVRPADYMDEVEHNLDRLFGMKIERRNEHTPVLRHDQFDSDVAETRNAYARHVNRRRIENNSHMLQ